MTLTSSPRGFVVAAVAVAAACGLVTATPAAPPPSAAASGGQFAGPRAGCDPSRRAVAFRPGGALVTPQPPGGPIPCAVDAGPGTESATVGVLPTGGRAGTVVTAPRLSPDHPPAPLTLLGPALVSASAGGNGRWRTTQPGDSAHVLFVPPWLSVDPTTSRIWFASVLPTLCGTKLSWSDDGGRRWQTNPAFGCPGMGSLRVLEGPAPAGGARPVGYPHVVYVCANATDLAESTVWCQRSLDGGRSFTFVGSFPDPPKDPGCATRHTARPGTVTPDGTLVFPVYACGQVSVAVSRDEGTTWQWHKVATGDIRDLYITSVDADTAGNLYLAWLQGPPPPGIDDESSPLRTDAVQGSGLPVLSVSRDGGTRWSAPRVVSPPGVTVAQRIAVTARKPGEVAVSYLGSTDAGATFNGYLTTSSTMLSRQPLLWGAPVNDPATPLMAGTGSGTGTGVGTFGDRLFFISNTIGPDGTPWSAFHCVRVASCSSSRSLVVGRLAEGSR
jgi:hypothetical protein